MSKKSIVLIGMDIGYSNLKIALSDGRCLVKPAGAVEESKLVKNFDGSKDDSQIYVNVDEETFVAGISWDKAPLASRTLHKNYTATKAYKALLHATLLLSEEDEIDTLVTGLPVSQFESMRESLSETITGVHQVTPKRKVTVKKTIVVPQPIGGFLHYLGQNPEFEASESRVLVIDPGHFSCDWVMIDKGSIQEHSSSTSLKASSIILDETRELIGKEYGAMPSVEDIENAFRKSKTTVKVLGQDVEIDDYIKKASKDISEGVLTSIQTSIRTSGEPDMVLLVGGGAKFYEDAVKSVFNKVDVITIENSVCANALGFLQIAKG